MTQCGGNLASISDFLSLMTAARDMRREIVLNLLGPENPCSQDALAELTRLHALLLSRVADSKLSVELNGRRHLHMDVHDELAELGKDLAFFSGDRQKEERIHFADVEGMCRVDRQQMEQEAAQLVSLIRPGIPDLVLITDWDGTMKDYGSNYSTCIQPAYSALILCLFAQRCSRYAAVLTAGPLRTPGILDLTSIPVARGYIAYGGCWGREWVIGDRRCVEDSRLSPGALESLEALTKRMEELLDARFPAFRYIGSGFQKKVDRLTFGVQNVSGDVGQAEMDALVGEIQAAIAELDPEGAVFHLDRGKFDMEVILCDADGSLWTKGDGVRYLEDLEPKLDLAGDSMILVCGDTASDLPMLRHVLRRNPSRTRAVFVNPSPALREELGAIFAGRPGDYACVSCPQVIHSAFASLLNEQRKG